MNWKKCALETLARDVSCSSQTGEKVGLIFQPLSPTNALFHCSVSLLPSCNANHPVTQPRLPLAWAILPSLFLPPLHPPHYCTSAGEHEGNHLATEKSLCGPSTTGGDPGKRAAPKQERETALALACKKTFLARDEDFPSSPTATF